MAFWLSWNNTLLWEFVTFHSVAPLDMGGEVVEVDEVLHGALVIMHLEIFKVSFGLTFGVMGSKVIF